MARKTIFELMANRMMRQAIRETEKAVKARRQSTGRQPVASESASDGVRRHRARYSLPSSTIKLASRGMHAYPVSGESFYPENFAALRQGLEEETFTRAFLIPDHLNPFDSNAVAVAVEGLQQALVVGHIPRHASSVFVSYLKGKSAECGARIYFSPDGERNSVELDCAFPPREAGEPDQPHEYLLESESPDFSMTQVTTVGGEYTKSELKELSLAEGQTRFGIAILREGFRDPTEICDAASHKLLGFPYQSIAWDFNIFTRSYGGEVRVAYKLDLNEKGRPRLALDASVLPRFKKSDY